MAILNVQAVVNDHKKCIICSSLLSKRRKPSTEKKPCKLELPPYSRYQTHKANKTKLSAQQRPSRTSKFALRIKNKLLARPSSLSAAPSNVRVDRSRIGSVHAKKKKTYCATQASFRSRFLGSRDGINITVWNRRKIHKKTQGNAFMGTVMLTPTLINQLKDTGYQRLELGRGSSSSSAEDALSGGDVRGQLVVSLMTRDNRTSPAAPTHQLTLTNSAIIRGPDDLPEGWEERQTSAGRIYFVDHINKTTHWERPRQQPSSASSPARSAFTGNIVLSNPAAALATSATPDQTPTRRGRSETASAASEQRRSGLPLTPSHSTTTTTTTTTTSHSTTSSNQRHSPELEVAPPTERRRSARHRNYLTRNRLHDQPGDLPPNFELRTTQQGQVYYYNNETGTSTWHDPRIPRDLGHLDDQDLGPLPAAWELRYTASGRPYFLNHVKRTTQFTDPRLSNRNILNSILLRNNREGNSSSSSLFSNSCSGDTLPPPPAPQLPTDTRVSPTNGNTPPLIDFDDSQPPPPVSDIYPLPQPNNSSDTLLSDSSNNINNIVISNSSNNNSSSISVSTATSLVDISTTVASPPARPSTLVSSNGQSQSSRSNDRLGTPSSEATRSPVEQSANTSGPSSSIVPVSTPPLVPNVRTPSRRPATTTPATTPTVSTPTRPTTTATTPSTSTTTPSRPTTAPSVTTATPAIPTTSSITTTITPARSSTSTSTTTTTPARSTTTTTTTPARSTTISSPAVAPIALKDGAPVSETEGDCLPKYTRDLVAKLNVLRAQLTCQVPQSGHCRLDIPRGEVFEESFRQISKLRPKDLKKRLMIKFRGEEGLDYGGVAREWLYLLSHEMLNPYYGLFQYSRNDIYTLQINPDSNVNPEHLAYFYFVGRVIGMAVFHGHYIDGGFAMPFYKMLLNKSIVLQDIEAVDPELYNSLNWILDNDITEVLDTTTFTVEHDRFGVLQRKDLKPGGSKICLTEDNKNEYVALYVNFRFMQGIERQFNALQKGFTEVVMQDFLAPFDERELELIIGGLGKIDVEDWKAYTRLKHCTAETPIVVWFWEIVSRYSEEMRARLLQFVTGSSRVPLQGFKDLQGSTGSTGPRYFTIHLIEANKENLPKAHTCFNRIDIPAYDNFAKMYEKLTQAVEETCGFAVE